jgi:hypothetical protein
MFPDALHFKRSNLTAESLELLEEVISTNEVEWFEAERVMLESNFIPKLLEFSAKMQRFSWNNIEDPKEIFC